MKSPRRTSTEEAKCISSADEPVEWQYSKRRRCWNHYDNDHLPDAGLEQKVAAPLNADAGLEERLERVALAVEAVDDVGAGLDERRLEHVRQEREHRVQRRELARGGRIAVLDAREQLREDRQVEDERRREQGVL